MKLCIYCGLRPGNTKDHVPSKCLFDLPLPADTQRITVPCCQICRRTGESDEALYRDLFISTRESEKNPIAVKLAAKRNKSFERDSSQTKRVVRHMRIVGVPSSKGHVPAFAFDFDSAEMHRFVLRVGRALLHEETKVGHVECRLINWGVNPEREIREDLLSIAKARVVSEEFAYAGVFLADEPVSFWLLNFYQALEFYAILTIERADFPSDLRKSEGKSVTVQTNHSLSISCSRLHWDVDLVFGGKIDGTRITGIRMA